MTVEYMSEAHLAILARMVGLMVPVTAFSKKHDCAWAIIKLIICPANTTQTHMHARIPEPCVLLVTDTTTGTRSCRVRVGRVPYHGQPSPRQVERQSPRDGVHDGLPDVDEDARRILQHTTQAARATTT